MPTAVQIGAGKIGRGFLGRLLCQGGYATTFLDTDSSLVGRLNARGSYRLRLATETGSETLTIDGFRAMHAHGPDALTSLGSADLVCTAVGAANLPQVAHQLAQAINARAGADAAPLDILLCENQWHAAELMRGLIAPHIESEAQLYFQHRVGLVETVIGIMVPVPTESMRAEDPLQFVTEPFDELPVARDMLRGTVPTLPGLLLADNIEAYEARKLYLHNMSHAAFAYLGYQQGHEYIWQCVADAQVAEVCREALRETAAAVHGWYGLTEQALEDYGDDLLRRFANRALGDTAARVAADPLRKLRPSDRLIGAADLCSNTGNGIEALAKIIAAALCYDNPSDHTAVELQRRRQTEGDEAVLQSLCDTGPETELSYRVRGALTQHDEWKAHHLCL